MYKIASSERTEAMKVVKMAPTQVSERHRRGVRMVLYSSGALDSRRPISLGVVYYGTKFDEEKRQNVGSYLQEPRGLLS